MSDRLDEPVAVLVAREEARSKRGHQKPSTLRVGEVRKISAHIDTLHARLDAVTRERDALREKGQELAADVIANARQQYGWPHVHPAQQRRYARDIETAVAVLGGEPNA